MAFYFQRQPSGSSARDAKPTLNRLIIVISPLLVDQIETFYLLKPVTLHAEIRQLHGSKRTSRAVSLFIEWLLTKNRKTS
jgi:hypothetical protein